MHRQPPTSPNLITHESIHPSVLMQGTISSKLTSTLATHPDLVCQLLPLEEQAKQHWHYVPEKDTSNDDTDVIDAMTEVVRRQSFIARTVKSLRRRVRGGDQTIKSQSVRMVAQLSEHSNSKVSESLNSGERDWLSSLMEETSLGHFVRDLI